MARECLGVCGLLNLTKVEDSGCTSLRVHLGSLLASGPALVLVLHLPVKCGSRTPGLEFCCRIASREEGYFVSWVPLGVERVAYMTTAYLKTLALICLTSCFGNSFDSVPIRYVRRYSFAVSKIVEGSLCCIVNCENLTSTC